MTRYLGITEGRCLEFKVQSQSNEPVLEAVVAMLNARGGKVVVGVSAQKGLATAVPGVVQPHEFATRLSQVLLDRIEPIPRSLVNVSVESTEDGPSVVVVEVAKAPDLCALRRNQAYWCATRESDQARALTFREIIALARRGADPTEQEREKAVERAARVVTAVPPAENGACGWCVYLAPVMEADVDNDTWRASRGRLVAELEKDAPFNARRQGWHIGLAPHAIPETRSSGDVVVLGRDRPLYRFAQFDRSGHVQAASLINGMETGVTAVRGPEGDGLMVEDVRLVEYAHAVVNAATWWWKELGVRGEVVAWLHMAGDTRFRVRPFARQGTVPREPGPWQWPPVSTPAVLLAEEEWQTGDRLARHLLLRFFDVVDLPDALDRWWREGRFVFDV